MRVPWQKAAAALQTRMARRHGSTADAKPNWLTPRLMEDARISTEHVESQLRGRKRQSFAPPIVTGGRGDGE